ncbi:MAG: YkgJ family cysteine cluster protein [Polyangiaceae bacterium]
MDLERDVLEIPPPCLECGTCCFSNLETSVRVTGDDYARLGDAVDRFVHFVGNRAYMRLAHGHCAALRVELEGRFVCTVYLSRPDACRDLERGSPHCQGELFTKKGRASERLVELRTRTR